jgi:uncharacterized protein
MQYRRVPKNGDRLSALGFGAMRLPTKRMKIDEDRATRQIRETIDRGINYIDTAAFYHGGESERFLGRALQGGYREKVRLATKLPPFSVHSRADMERILEIQLKKLQTDRVDYYLLHALEANHWKRLCELGVREFLEQAKAAGTIRNAGFSFHGDRRTFKEIIDGYDWVLCLIQYSLLDQTNQAGTEGLEYAASKRVAVAVMEPLRGGLLAGKLPREVAQINARAGSKRSPAEWALRWVWNHPGVTVVLSGMNDERHIAENLRTCEDALPGTLTAEELRMLEEVTKAFQGSTRVGCTGCAYCMPCPSGVNIPLCFSMVNEYHAGRGKFRARAVYGGLLMGGVSRVKADASLCSQCGKCVAACPQKIAIPEELAKVDRELGGWRTKMLFPLMRMVIPARVKE